MSANCVFDLRGKEIDKVQLYSDSDITFYVPIQAYKPVLTPTVGSTIGDFAISATATAFEPTVRDGSVELPEVEEEMSVGGEKATVKIEWIQDRSNDETYQTQLTTLMQNWYHVLLTFSDGMQAIVRATEDSYVFTYNESDGDMTCAIEIENISGIQRVKEIEEEEDNA